MTEHTTGAPAPTIERVRRDLLFLSLVIGAYSSMSDEYQREVAELVMMIGETPRSIRADELALLIGTESTDARQAQAHGEQEGGQ